MATATLDRAETLVATERQRQEASEFLRAFSAQSEMAGPRPVTIPSDLFRLMAEFLAPVVEGRKVLVLSTLPEELTTTVAAKVMGVSRPTLMRYIRDGLLPAHRVGSHTRVMRDDVLAFQESEVARRRSAVRELRKLTDEIGV